MTAGRLYCIQSWNNASETSGEQIGNRLAQSRGLHFNRDGSANTFLYSEENNEKKKAPSVPLVDRVLPQQRRVRVLTEQLYELEAERKAGMDLITYSQLRDVLICKRDRAEVLLKKALRAKPKREESEEYEGFSSYASSDHPSDNDGHGGSYSSPVGVGFIDELSNDNSFKKILQEGCKGVRTLVRWHQATRNYIKTLSGV